MDILERRIIFSDSDEESRAVELLDEAGEDYDWDSGDRMMITDSGIKTLDKGEVDFDVIV